MKIQIPYNFTPRPYQEPTWNSCYPESFRRGILVWPRRNGKDLFCWNLVIAKALQRVGLYYYIAPYYNQARQIIWEGIDGAGRRFLDYVPEPLISGMYHKGRTKLDMRQKLPNGSQIKLVGSDKIDSIVGTNPIGIVFTEFSLHKRGVWDYLRPILAENGGWALFNGTPRGMANEFYELYTAAIRPESDWFLQHITRDDTGVPTLEAIEEDRRSGMPEPLVLQEYYTNFLTGNVGTYYSTEMEILRQADRITRVPYDPRLPVYTFWDLGKRDACAIWFAQFHQHEIRLINYWEQTEAGLPKSIKYVREQPYVYEAHYAPHDIVVEEMSTLKSRWETAAELGIEFMIVPKLPLMDGIDAVRDILPRCWFDKERTELGRRALEHYHKKYDDKGEVFSETPAKSWANHGADGFRYLSVIADSIIETREWGTNRPRRIRAVGQEGARRFAPSNSGRLLVPEHYINERGPQRRRVLA
ncbi:MAG: hypothetical protein ACPKM1_15630 [Spirochaetaceae bacterium]